MYSDLFGFNSFFNDTLSQFTDSPSDSAHDHFPYGNSQEIQENSNIFVQKNNIPVDETSSFDQIASVSISSSPKNPQLENSSLSHLGNANYSALEVKTEEFQLCFDCCSNSFLSHNFDAAHETAANFMHKSYSHDYYFQNKRNFSFRPQFDRVSESQSPQNRILNSPEITRREKIVMQTRNNLSSSPLYTEKSSFMEEDKFKVRRYSIEERRERIDRYRAKRTQRNFNKTIKYACRKTLAETRPRIRGRFARSDEVGEIHKTSTFHKYEDDDYLWIDGIHEEYGEGIAQKGSFLDSFDSADQYQNYSY